MALCELSNWDEGETGVNGQCSEELYECTVLLYSNSTADFVAITHIWCLILLYIHINIIFQLQPLLSMLLVADPEYIDIK